METPAVLSCRFPPFIYFFSKIEIQNFRQAARMTNKVKDKKSNIEVSEVPSPYSPAQIRNFLEEVKVEFSKIVWPDKKMTVGLAGIVVVMTIVISIYLGSVDLVIGKIVGGFLR